MVEMLADRRSDTSETHPVMDRAAGADRQARLIYA